MFGSGLAESDVGYAFAGLCAFRVIIWTYLLELGALGWRIWYAVCLCAVVVGFSFRMPKRRFLKSRGCSGA